LDRIQVQFNVTGTEELRAARMLLPEKGLIERATGVPSNIVTL
jgi:hypothetical protein